MTRRSIRAEKNQTIIIKAGGSVTVKAHDSDLVTAESRHRGGLTLERRSPSEIGRARAAVGEHVLFDLRIKLPNLREGKAPEEVIEIQLGGSGEVRVPIESNLKVYAAKDIDVYGIQGHVDAYSGLNLNLKDVYVLGRASAGRALNIDCQSMANQEVTYSAGSDLRFHVTDLTSARIRVKDLGGYWEARIGDGEKSVYLKSGGDAVLVTDQTVEPLPPNYILGAIEKPAER